MSVKLLTFEQRVMQRVVIDENGCWLWGGYRNRSGYGVMWVAEKSYLAHRYSYEHHFGPIPKGLETDHLCRQRACVNPSHLEPVTHQENIRRGDSGIYHRLKTHCPHGHPYDKKNTYYRRTGGRECRECANIRNAKRAEALRMEAANG